MNKIPDSTAKLMHRKCNYGNQQITFKSLPSQEKCMIFEKPKSYVYLKSTSSARSMNYHALRKKGGSSVTLLLA